MAVEQTYGLKELLMAIMSSTVVSAFLTLIAGRRLNVASTRKVTMEVERMETEKSADVELALNKRFEIILAANDSHIKFLTEEIARLRMDVRLLSTELQAARQEISALQRRTPGLDSRAPVQSESGQEF